jgi:uncharacterized protein YbaP (TraB family)
MDIICNNRMNNSPVHITTSNVIVCGIAGDYCVMNTIKNLLKYNGPCKLNILVFTRGIASIDDGTTIKDHLSEDTYEKMKDYFTSVGMYNPLLNQYNAGFWVNLCDELMLTKIDNLELSGTDAYFINKAKEDGKEVIEIETMAIQGNALTAYSDELADYLLSKSIDNAEDIEGYAEDLANLYNVWASGSGEIMEEVEKLEEDAEELPEDLKDDEEAYNKIMLTDRNHGMAEKASEYLKEGKNCLFMVGAAHYGGEEGVDNLLEDMGYTVEKIE